MKEIRLKNLTLCVPPFMITQGHWNRHGSIRHLRLTVNVPYQPWVYLVPFFSETNGDFSRKPQIRSGFV